MTAQYIGELSVKLADAALIAREKGDDVHAIFFAVKAAETLALAKALGWDGGVAVSSQHQQSPSASSPGGSAPSQRLPE